MVKLFIHVGEGRAMEQTDKDAIKSVLIVGYGSMGRGIGLPFFAAGFNTTVLTQDLTRITDLPQRTSALQQLPKKSPDLIIEAVPKNSTQEIVTGTS